MSADLALFPYTMAGFELFCSEIVPTLCFGLKPTEDTFNGKNDIKLLANFANFKFQHDFQPFF